MTCKQPRVDGTPCRATARATGYCWAHDPELRDKGAEARARGGHNSGKTVRARRELANQIVNLIAGAECSCVALVCGAAINIE